MILEWNGWNSKSSKIGEIYGDFVLFFATFIRGMVHRSVIQYSIDICYCVTELWFWFCILYFLLFVIILYCIILYCIVILFIQNIFRIYLMNLKIMLFFPNCYLSMQSNGLPFHASHTSCNTKQSLNNHHMQPVECNSLKFSGKFMSLQVD